MTPDWGPDHDHWHRDPDHQQGNQNMSNLNLGNTLASVWTTLSNAGLTGAALQTAVQTLSANSPNAAVLKCCTVVMSNLGNPSVILDECRQMAEIPNLPASVAQLLPVLAAAAQAQPINPLAVQQVVSGIETAMGQSGGAFGLHLPGF